MKSLQIFIKSSLVLSLFIAQAFASNVGTVKKVYGNAFLSAKGKTTQLAEGDFIPLGAEIMTEEGAQVSVMDYHDRLLHLSGSGQFKMGRHKSVLMRGYLWIQSYQASKTYDIETANARSTILKGEGVLSFDNASGRSQLLVVNGQFHLSNSLEDHLKLELRGGQFSFVDSKYEDGMPRRPTQIGYSSYNKVTGLFYNVKPFSKSFQEKKNVARSIASEAAPAPKAKKKVLFFSSKINKLDDNALSSEKTFLNKVPTRTPASVAPKAPEVKKTKEIKGKSGVRMRIFGFPSTSSVEAPAAPKVETMAKQQPKVMIQKAKRAPASVQATKVNSNNRFENSVKSQYSKKKRHTKEVNSLIDDLKSYQQDYKKNY